MAQNRPNFGAALEDAGERRCGAGRSRRSPRLAAHRRTRAARGSREKLRVLLMQQTFSESLGSPTTLYQALRPWGSDKILLDPSADTHRTHMFRKLVSDGVNRVEGVVDVVLIMAMLLVCGSSELLQVNHAMIIC